MIGIYKGYSSSEDFWADFSRKKLDRKGVEIWEKLPWTAIVSKARQLRDKINERDAESAKLEFSSNFNERFSYRVGSAIKVYATPLKIASRYRRLKNRLEPWDSDEENDV